MDKGYKYEYDYFDIGCGVHYGVHSMFGEHLAIGRGGDMVHLYPYKLSIGESERNAVKLNPEQQCVLRRLFQVVRRQVEAAKIQGKHKSGVLPDGFA